MDFAELTGYRLKRYLVFGEKWNPSEVPIGMALLLSQKGFLDI